MSGFNARAGQAMRGLAQKSLGWLHPGAFIEGKKGIAGIEGAVHKLKMKTFQGVWFAFVLGLATSPSANAMSAPRAPTAKWVVDFADNMCTATRSYGTAEKPLHLTLKPSPTGGTVQLIVISGGGSGTLSGEPEQHSAKIQLGNADPFKVSMLVYGQKSGNSWQNVHIVTLPTKEWAPIKSASSLRIDSLTALDVTFALSQMGTVVNVLDRCIADLLEHWGMTPDQQARVKTEPRSEAPSASYFRDDDYPRGSLQLHQSGSTSVRLLIDEGGKIADCAVTSTSGSAALDTMTCFVLRTRAKFRPALDKDDKPLKSFVDGRIHWVIPD